LIVPCSVARVCPLGVLTIHRLGRGTSEIQEKEEELVAVTTALDFSVRGNYFIEERVVLFELAPAEVAELVFVEEAVREVHLLGVIGCMINTN